MNAFDPSQFPVARKGRKFEDFYPGQLLEHHWGRTFTDAENALFSTAMCNWNPMYLNVEFAQAHGHKATVVNPMFVLCSVVGMSVEDLSEAGGPFLGLEDCTFSDLVYPGDTVVARSEVLECRESKSHPKSGIVTWHTQAFNQNDHKVLEFKRLNLVAKRAVASASVSSNGQAGGSSM